MVSLFVYRIPPDTDIAPAILAAGLCIQKNSKKCSEKSGCIFSQNKV